MEVFDSRSLATELVVTPHRLDDYLTGNREMPLDRQLCLALLLIERVPALARQGYALRGQVLAAIAYAARQNGGGESAAPRVVTSNGHRPKRSSRPEV
jgi:hypothetical protein